MTWIAFILGCFMVGASLLATPGTDGVPLPLVIAVLAAGVVLMLGSAYLGRKYPL